MKLPNTVRRAFSRPIQLSCYAVMGISTQYLLPDKPEVMQWVAYAFIYIAMLALGLDNYTEGMERGIKISSRFDQ